jgi:hypothetical protein
MEPKINTSDLSIKIMAECKYVWNELRARNDAIKDCMRVLFEMDEGFLKLSYIHTSFDAFKFKYYWDDKFLTSLKFHTYRAETQWTMEERIKHFRHVSYTKMVRMMRIIPWYLGDWGKTLMKFFVKVDLDKCPTSELRFWFVNMVGYTCEELVEQYSDSYTLTAEQLRRFGSGHKVFPKCLPRPKPFHPCLKMIDGCEQDGKIYDNLPGFVYQYAEASEQIKIQSQVQQNSTASVSEATNPIFVETEDFDSPSVDSATRLSLNNRSSKKGELTKSMVHTTGDIIQVEEQFEVINFNIPDEAHTPVAAWSRKEVLKPRTSTRPTMTVVDNKQMYRKAVTNATVQEKCNKNVEDISKKGLKIKPTHDKLGRNTAVINSILAQGVKDRPSCQSIVAASAVDLVRRHLNKLQEAYRGGVVTIEPSLSSSIPEHHMPGYKYFIIPMSRVQ